MPDPEPPAIGVTSKLEWEKLLRRSPISHAQYRVLMTVASYTDKHGKGAHPGWARLASDAEVNERTAKAAVVRLLDLGWLVQTGRGGNAYGKGTANTYALSTPPATPQGG